MPAAKPVLFISHKHVDRAIADALRTFVMANTAAGVQVYQSSSWQAAGPRAGKDLHEQLKNALWDAHAFILIHTDSGLDWSYCVFEYGLANAANSPSTNSVFLQCSHDPDDVPSLFAGQVVVNARELESIKKFARDLLTHGDFFANNGGPITHHAPDSLMVEQAAEELYRNLAPLLPPKDAKGWPAYPSLQLQLEREHVDAIATGLEGVVKGRPPTTAELRDVPAPRQELFALIQVQSRLTDYDKHAPSLFKSTRFERGAKLETLVEAWRAHADRKASSSRWVESLCWQISEVARDEFPPFTWTLMQGADKSWYVPRVMHVWHLPHGHMKLDIYFVHVDLEAARQSRWFWRRLLG
jgi:hypothetical protein